MKMKKTKGNVYQLKINLTDVRPPVWRRVLVEDDATFKDLHYILQAVIGWSNSHLHQFITHRGYIADPEQMEEFDGGDEGKIRLKDVIAGVKYCFGYEYDFGDSWSHRILVEKILSKENRHYPVCLDGKRACPPEDCGGIWGYEEFLNAIKNPKHPEHKEMLEWFGGEFDPEEFNLDEINELL